MEIVGEDVEELKGTLEDWNADACNLFCFYFLFIEINIVLLQVILPRLCIPK